MSKQSKITIQHYLNDKLKADRFSEKKIYPVYVRVSFLRKNFRFRSVLLRDYYSDLDFDIIKNKKIMEYEKEIITFAIRENEDIEDLSSYLYFLKYDVIHILKLYILSKDSFSNSNFYELLTDEIKKFIVEKTKINIDALSCFVKIDRDIDNSFFTLFDESIIKNEDLKKAVLFIKLLLEFAKTEYINNSLNCYEWKYKTGKINFLKFLENKNNDFSEHILLIDNYISRN